MRSTARRNSTSDASQIQKLHILEQSTKGKGIKSCTMQVARHAHEAGCVTALLIVLYTAALTAVPKVSEERA
jgi:hypothetical protein